jgi:hypothetical protein
MIAGKEVREIRNPTKAGEVISSRCPAWEFPGIRTFGANVGVSVLRFRTHRYSFYSIHISML